jgi:hypothetical protein
LALSSTALTPVKASAARKAICLCRIRNKKTGPLCADRFFAKLSFKSLETNLALPPEIVSGRNTIAPTKVVPEGAKDN